MFAIYVCVTCAFCGEEEGGAGGSKLGGEVGFEGVGVGEVGSEAVGGKSIDGDWSDVLGNLRVGVE